MRHVFTFVACVACGVVVAAEPPQGETPGATAQLKPTQGNSVSGTLNFASIQSSVRITGVVHGLKPNSEQGFHVHAKGDCSAPDASSAGDHFNPTSQPHGNPKTAEPHHLGDMVNLRADAKGTAKVDVSIEGAGLHTGRGNDLFGKAVVVHQKPDDYKTQPSGNSGDRVACGVIAEQR
jgi:Cu-Zn family superoxide dismutase